jgi:hypothetical protein
MSPRYHLLFVSVRDERPTGARSKKLFGSRERWNLAVVRLLPFRCFLTKRYDLLYN